MLYPVELQPQNRKQYVVYHIPSDKIKGVQEKGESKKEKLKVTESVHISRMH